MSLTNSYLDLGPDFYEKVTPSPVVNPHLLLWNEGLAEELGMEELLASAGSGPESRPEQVFSGNVVLPDSTPLALVYAGHQFGHFVPQLGDGRAHLLGELHHRDGTLRDLQLKGSGPTRFSRQGDGRCALGPAVREFIMSEAMAALGVPTTRSLAVVSTGEEVLRQPIQPGAVVTRVAMSHLRVGTFEFFAARRDRDALRRLLNFSIRRHDADLAGLDEPDMAMALLDRVMERQIKLVCAWLRVGFIHGVMNTDNTTISGETIDYGPCAMLGVYDPQTVYSSIDHHGRYAFGNQPIIAQWNMVRLAECLIPFLHEEEEKAIELARERIDRMGVLMDEARHEMMAQKLGLNEPRRGDKVMIDTLLSIMEDGGLDYTVTFSRLTRAVVSDEARQDARKDLGQEWLDGWLARLDEEAEGKEGARRLMARNNPLVIPRNHHVERVIADMVVTGDPSSCERFLEVLRDPWSEGPLTADYQDPPAHGDRGYKTFCGT